MKAVRTLGSIQQERAAKGALFAAFRQELTLQVPLASLPLRKRPIHQLQSKPRVWKRFLAGQRKEFRADEAHEQRIVENLSWPADEVWSIQFEVSEEFSCLLNERGNRNLFASCLQSTWVDAEALTEGDLCNVKNLCSTIAPDGHFDEFYPTDAIVVTLGDEACVLWQSLTGCGDQWEAPTHEISNLLNRRLFPQRVAIYLYPDSESGTYVIVERDRASEILKRIHALDKAVAARQKAEFLLPVECCAACGVAGVMLDEPPMRGCRECGRLMHERCLLIKVDLNANSDDWFRGATPEACPFCSGKQIQPDDVTFVNGYTLGLRQARVRRLTLAHVKPLIAFRRADLNLRCVTRVDRDAAIALCRQKGNVLLGSVEESTRELLKQRDGEVSEMVLTMRLAHAFLKDQDEAKLKEYVTIEDTAAVTLLKHGGSLHLEGLIRLSDTAVTVLAKHKHALYLHALEVLSDAAAITLATHGGSGLAIGVTSLSDVAAQALAGYSGCLRLVGLASLSDAAAQALASHKGDLCLDAVTTLSDAAAAALAEHAGGALDLPCLRDASDAGLAALALHKGDLDLNGLLALSEAAADALAGHRGDLQLDGLTKLSDASAAALAQHDGPLHLYGVATLSNAALKAFAKHKGYLDLGITTLTENRAATLATHEGQLGLFALAELTAAAAKTLLKHGSVETHLDLESIAAEGSG